MSQQHALDIRTPMGTMFSLLGLVLAGYGVISYGSGAYTRSLGINVNLWWGIVILLFGLTMLMLSYRGRRMSPPPARIELPPVNPSLPLKTVI